MKRVIIDTREPPYIYEVAKKILKDFDVVKHKLEVGDIQFDNVIIERKTPGDAINSMKRPSFWTNLFIMKNNFDHPFLYLDGDMDDWVRTVSRRGTPFSGIEGSMVSVILTGIPILSFAKPESAFRWFSAMFNKVTSTSSPSTAKLSISKRKANLHELRTASIMCVPRIGNVSAEHLLNEKKSVYKVIMDSKEGNTPQDKRINEFFFGKEDDKKIENE